MAAITIRRQTANIHDVTNLTPRIRGRLETQGYTCSTESEFDRLMPWVRFSPLLCSTIGAIGTFLAAPKLLLWLALSAALGVIFPNHPFDQLYNHGIRRLTGTRPLPPSPPPRRFACAIAMVWLVATGSSFQRGRKRLGYVLGTLFVVISGLNALYICVPSMVYRAVFRQSTH